MNDGIGNSVQCNTRCHHGEDCPEWHGQVDAGVALERVEQADEDEGDGADVEVGQHEPRLDKNEKLDVLEVNSHGQNIFPRIFPKIFPKKLHIKKLQ